MPRGAIYGGGPRNDKRHICRFRYKDGLHPGKLVGRNCYIGWGGKEISMANYEVMVARGSARVAWIGGRNGTRPNGAVVGGGASGKGLYICRGRAQSGWHPGKLVGRNCNVGLHGKEMLFANYEVLTLNRQVAAQPPSGRPTGSGIPTGVPRGAPRRPPPVVGTTEQRSFAVANRTTRPVHIYEERSGSRRQYIGTVQSGRVWVDEVSVGKRYLFAHDNQWLGAYRVDQRNRRQLIELPTTHVYVVP